MMDILTSETCWAHKKWNKIASDIKLLFYSSSITMMHGPINIRLFLSFIDCMKAVSCRLEWTRSLRDYFLVSKWHRIFVQKLIFAQLVRTFLAFVEFDNLYPPSHPGRYSLSVGTQMSSNLRTLFHDTMCNIIVLSIPTSAKWKFRFLFPTKAYINIWNRQCVLHIQLHVLI